MRHRWLCTLVVVAALAAACSNSSSDDDVSAGETSDDTAATATSDTSGTDTSTDGDPYPRRDEFVELPDVDGVTDTEIRVAGVASATNPLQVPFGQTFAGTELYFDQVNEAGGIYGRDLVLVAEHDDETVNNQAEVTKILAQDNAFAVAPVSVLVFSGAAELVAENVPTFGWNIQEEFQGSPNLFGMRGYLCFECAGQLVPWLAQDQGRTKVGILAFDVPQSETCAIGLTNSFEKYPSAEVVFEDRTIPYGNPDYSVQVGKMKDAGVDLVTTCMDNNAVALLGEEMAKQKLDAIQYMPNSYDSELAERYAKEFEGSLVMTQFTPFEVPEPPDGLVRFMEAAEAEGIALNEQTLAGWVAGDMVHTALLEAGPEFDRASVIDAMNQRTDYDADGILPYIDWTTGHTEQPENTCFVISEIVDGGFEPLYGEPGKPFICFEVGAPELSDPVRSD